MSCTHVPVVYAGDLRRARGCAKSLQMGGLHLITRTSKKNTFYKELLALIKADINIPDDEIMDYSYSHVKNEWFDLNRAASQYAERLAQKVIRMRQYILDNGYIIVNTDYPIEVDYANDAKYGIVGTAAYSFGKVKDKCDFVFEKNGEKHFVKIILKSLPYSYRGQSEATQAIYSPELLAIRTATAAEYPDAYVDMWSLTSKDDKPGRPAPYEGGRGKNIISMRFNLNEADAKSELLRSCEIVTRHTLCSECPYAEYCSYAGSAPDIQSLSKSNDQPVEEVVREAEAVKGGDAEVRFTDAQIEAINHGEGPISVVAVPGAGKTRVIVERAVRLIEKQGIPASKILMISFTLKACSEIRERLKDRVSELPDVMTFNALGAMILRNNLKDGRMDLLTEGKVLSTIKDILDREDTPEIKNVSYDGATRTFGLLPMLQHWFNYINANGEEQFKREYSDKDVDNILYVYSEYKKATKHCITFDEQITECNRLFAARPELAQEIAKHYSYIIVDEYQDANEEQAQMLYTIAHHHNNLMVVGDDDQAIYAWRGGNKRFIMDFNHEFPGARRVYMSDNFRSTQNVLAAASKCLDVIEDRDDKTFITHHVSSFRPALIKNCPVSSTASLVRRALATGYKAGEIAILGRTNKVLDEVARILSDDGIKNRPAKTYLREDAVFLAIYDALSLYYGGYEDINVYRLLRMLKVEDSELQKIWWDKSLYDNLLLSGVIKNLSDTRELYKHKDDSSLHAALYKLTKINMLVENTINPLDFCKEFLKTFGAVSHPVLASLAECIANANCTDTEELYQMMKNMILYNDSQRIEYGIDMSAVNLLTAHDSKGKEFRCVIIAGIEDFNTDDESRRLLFVAMSRAKETLYLLQSPYSEAPMAEELRPSLAVYG